MAAVGLEGLIRRVYIADRQCGSWPHHCTAVDRDGWDKSVQKRLRHRRH